MRPPETSKTWRSADIEAILVIPARYGSTRLPGKPLLDKSGKCLIEHVYRGAGGSRLARKVIVATDDSRIYQAVLSFGGNVCMTSEHHRSGSDRVAEVASRTEGDIFVNVQGDEPEISPEAIDQVIRLLQDASDADVATLAVRVTAEEAENPNLVKVVLDRKGHALYFSRSKIPHGRSEGYLGHIGIYAYRRDFLLRYPSLPESELETNERLEQLRILENGYRILVGVTTYRSRGIDTPEDYERFLERLASS